MRLTKHVTLIIFLKIAQKFDKWNDLTPIIVDFQAYLGNQ